MAILTDFPEHSILQPPRLEFDDNLPISQHRERIMAAIRDHQVVVVCGETGSGKTTQLPKLCLALGLGNRGLIGHTQPRRIAARSVAARIAEELHSPLGEWVGYKVRFSDRIGSNTRVKLMTDGILLAETQSDRRLDKYRVIIVDEAHERSLNIDFLLGYLRRLLPHRPDLKLIITSATIDPERFSKHFQSVAAASSAAGGNRNSATRGSSTVGDAPIIEVSGRSYPVDIRYRPLISEDEDEQDRDREQAILDAVDELAGLDRAAGRHGDILIFLNGERDIRDTAEALRKHKPPNTEILPLYARLSAAEQNRVFQPHAGRRIVLATNVAETSLTVPGIRYVIDPGTARVSRYSTRAKVQRLPIEKISQASAAQRAGRCGRVAPGVCIRLYAEEDFNARPAFTEPEILRTNLAAVILQMAALKLGEVEAFPFLESPERRQITDGYKLLFELGAVDGQRRITDLGRRLARLPVDPRLGRMLLAAAEFGSLREVLIIAAALAIQDPRERPMDRQQAADEKHRRFRDARSDFQALLNLWDYYHEQARHLTRNKLRQLCRDEFLSYVRMREWHDLHRELQARVTEMGLRPNSEPADYAAIHRALLSGLLGQIGLHHEDRSWRSAGGRKFLIFPGSGLFKKGPKWLMAAELVETSRLYARTVAQIDPAWIEPLAPHLVKRSHSEPHWEPRRGQVGALESVSLYGLPLISGRKVNYGPIDPPVAREIFIREALVQGRFRTGGEFFAHNRQLIESIRELEVRTRRRDLLIDEDSLYRFYAERIPENIYSGPAFERWRRKAEREQPRLLFLSRDELLAQDPAADTEEQFPDRLHLDGMALPLAYRFEPGAEDDGVTVTIPLAALNQVDPRRLEWLVPGLLTERMAALLKSLPKSLRKHFVPVPNYVQALREALRPGSTALTDAMAQRLATMTGVEVPASAWQTETLPPHLRMRIRVVNGGGDAVAVGRDLAALQRELRGQARTTFADRSQQQTFEREAVSDWDFGPLPEQVEFEQGGVALKGYPALVGEGDKLALRLLDTPGRAEREHRVGVRGLLERKLRDKLRYLQRQLPGLQAMSLHYLGIGSQRELLDDLLAAAVERACFGEQPVPRDADAFRTCLSRGREQLVTVANRLAEQVAAILASHHRIARRLQGEVPLSWQEAVTDIREQLETLVYPGFIRHTPEPWLSYLPRYLQAIEVRLEKLRQAPDKDRRRRAAVESLWQEYRRRQHINDERDRYEPELERFRWSIEELRVSQFAQELKTAEPVSVKRLEQRWRELVAA